MKNLTLSLAAFCLMLLSSCAAIEGVFKAGYYVGIFVVVIILAVVFFIVSKFRG